ncbi:MAG: hypothetical protein QOG94_985, partial [Solirubrobacteraceae bacterium]|nr:hypothetical protein [Solirubrobacteraceae bacterium]
MARHLTWSGWVCLAVLAGLLSQGPGAGAAVVDPCVDEQPGASGWCGDGGPATQA